MINFRRKPDTGLLLGVSQSYYRNRRLMRRGFKALLMSDTKWRKLFFAIERLNLCLPLFRVKFIDGTNEMVLSTPTSRSFYAPRQFVEAVEFGPYELCAIEWLEFPRSVAQEGNWMSRRHGTIIEQDVERAEQALKRVALFPMELTESGLRVTGHLRYETRVTRKTLHAS